MAKAKRLKYTLFDIRRRPKPNKDQQARILKGIRQSSRSPGPARAKMLRRKKRR